MATLYDRNGNEVYFPDDQVEAALAETHLVHRKTQPRYFRARPALAEQSPADGAERARVRAARKMHRLMASGELDQAAVPAALTEELARVSAQLAGSGDPKRAAMASLVADATGLKERLVSSPDERLRVVGGLL